MTKINSFTDPTKVRKSGDTMTGVLTQNGANLAGTAYQNQSFQNLIKNGIPESWSAGTSTYPDNWILHDSSGTPTISKDTVNFVYGSSSLKIQNSAGGRIYIKTPISNFATYKSKKVTVGFWSKSSHNNFIVDIYDGVGDNSLNLGNSNVFEYHTISRTIDANATGIWVLAGISTTATAETLSLNGITLVEGSVVPAFSPRPLYDDGKTLQIDSANNRIGINIAPVYPIHSQALTDVVGLLALSQQNSATSTWLHGAFNDGTYRLWRSTNNDANKNYFSMKYDTGFLGLYQATPESQLHIGNNTLSTTLILDGSSAGNSYTMREGGVAKAQYAISIGNSYFDYYGILNIRSSYGGSNVLTLLNDGKLGLGMTPTHQLELSTDSAAKPGAGGLWTVVSDERIKKDIVQADLDRCYEIVKSVPLKYFAWNDGVYTDKQVKDRHNLGWIAQDVQKVFPKATNVIPFTKNKKIPDGEEEYEEQNYTIELVEKEVVSIEIRNGIPVQIKKMVSEEKKTMLFDTVNVVDEIGKIVMNGETPLTYQVPTMVKKTKPKFKQDVIEDCLDLNAGQMYAAMYGALQKAMQKIEMMEATIILRCGVKR